MAEFIIEHIEDIRGRPIRQREYSEDNEDNKPTYGWYLLGVVIGNGYLHRVSIRLLLDSSVEFRCENDQDKARNEREVLKQLGVKLVNLEPELTMAVQETTGPNEKPDAVVEYSRNQGNGDDGM